MVFCVAENTIHSECLRLFWPIDNQGGFEKQPETEHEPLRHLSSAVWKIKLWSLRTDVKMKNGISCDSWATAPELKWCIQSVLSQQENILEYSFLLLLLPSRARSALSHHCPFPPTAAPFGSPWQRNRERCNVLPVCFIFNLSCGSWAFWYTQIMYSSVSIYFLGQK